MSSTLKIYYNKCGEECDEEKSLAYKTDKTYYIREYLAHLAKKDTVVTLHNRARYIWRKVSADCFKMYLSYLKSGRDIQYFAANRNRG